MYGLLDENRKYKDFQLFPADDSIVNDIYVARVGRILKGINGAFVNISPKQSCYISLNDLSDPVYVNKKSKKPGIHEGDEILVQIGKRQQQRQKSLSLYEVMHIWRSYDNLDN